MPTISSRVTDKELEAIQEYANSCGETISNVIRKTVISKAIFQDYYSDAEQYSCDLNVTEGKDEDQEVLSKINRIRKILGLKIQSEI